MKGEIIKRLSIELSAEEVEHLKEVLSDEQINARVQNVFGVDALAIVTELRIILSNA